MYAKQAFKKMVGAPVYPFYCLAQCIIEFKLFTLLNEH